MRSSFPASWATSQTDPKPTATPSGPAPVLILAATAPVAGSRRTSFFPSNDVTQTAPYAAVARSGTPGTSTVRSGASAPVGIRATVWSLAATTQTLPSSVVVSPTGPKPTSTCGASSTSASLGVGSGRAEPPSVAEQAAASSASGSRAQKRTMPAR
jgi:hypothetical protein